MSEAMGARGLRRGKSQSYAADLAGAAPGFDALRLALALLIFYAHTRLVLTSDPAVIAGAGPILEEIGSTPLLPASDVFVYLKSNVYRAYVPMFFALSGYLVCGSAIRVRSSLTFLYFRALRIVPALSVEVILSAFVLGPVFTSLVLPEYFSSWETYRYLGNIFGFVTFNLPGVFTKNPFSGIVNVNLWALPAEFYCYLIFICIFSCFDIKERRRLFVAIVAAIGLAATAHAVLTPPLAFPRVFMTAPVVYHFFVGAAFYLYADRIPLSLPAVVVAAVGTALLLGFRQMEYAIAPILTYVTVYIGHLGFLRSNFLRRNDFSYGIYLYGFPIKQAFVALFPGIGRGTLFVCALAVTGLFALLSWTFIERRFLALKNVWRRSATQAPAVGALARQPTAPE